MTQDEHSAANRAAWSHRAYESWHRFQGTPQEAAEEIRSHPKHVMRHTLHYFGDVKGKKVANLLGSHGRRALALALLGAEVTIVDISEGNQRYALEAAQALGVPLEYIVSDVMGWPADDYGNHFDFVLMENGILHYFTNLNPLMRLVHNILKPGGTFILHEFHPIQTKCLPRREGDLMVLDGDYFSEHIIEFPAAFHGAFSEEEVEAFPKGRMKYWTMGEIVTAAGMSRLKIKTLTEQPRNEPAVPDTFTLVAKK